MKPALMLYALGVTVGLLRTDAAWPTRVGLALAWPLAALAFVVTVSVLLLTALVAFPLFGAIVVGGAALGYVLSQTLH